MWKWWRHSSSCSRATYSPRLVARRGGRGRVVNQFAVHSMHENREGTIDAYGSAVSPA